MRQEQGVPLFMHPNNCEAYRSCLLRKVNKVFTPQTYFSASPFLGFLSTSEPLLPTTTQSSSLQSLRRVPSLHHEAVLNQPHQSRSSAFSRLASLANRCQSWYRHSRVSPTDRSVLCAFPAAHDHGHRCRSGLEGVQRHVRRYRRSECQPRHSIKSQLCFT